MGILRSFFAALSFLTFVPYPASLPAGEKDLGRSPYFFPLVGLLLGGLVVPLDLLFVRVFHSWYVVNCLVVLALIGFSRALHLDGFADSADGFLSSRPRERTLEIMRDSRIGSAGAMAVFGLLLLKWSALMSVPLEQRWQTLLLVPLAGRCALLFQLALLPYARKEGGLATAFLECSRPLLLTIAITFLGGVGFLVLSFMGIVIALCSLVFAALFSLYCHRRLGGLTGDTLGAVCELSELVPLLVLVVCGGSCFDSY